MPDLQDMLRVTGFCYIGVDPGVSGGIAVITHAPVVSVTAFSMPPTDRDILDLLEHYQQVDTFAVLERVSTSPQMGVVSAGTFMGNYRALQMALTALRIPFDLVTPRKWQQAMGCLTGGDKNVSKRRAQQLFPGLKCTHAISDALLLAEYCRRVRRDGYGHHTKEEARGETPSTPARETRRA